MRLILRIALAAGAAAIPLFADDTAVLPFANVSSSASSSVDWIGESIAENLRSTFSARGVLTLERDRIAEAYRRLQLRERAELTEGSILKLGEVLDAEHVVHGTFFYTPAPVIAGTISTGATSKGSLKIQARVSDRLRLRQSAVFEESGAVEDLATLEAHLAWRALTAVSPAQAPAESEFRSLRMPVPLDALENYIR